MAIFRRICLGLAGLAALTLLVGLFAGRIAIWEPSAVVLAVGASIGLGAIRSLKTYQYTAWIIAAVVAALAYPNAFLHWGDFDLRNKWLILLVVQGVMFGMGTQMSLRDFEGVAMAPRGVFIGMLCQFTIMPLSGFVLTKIFHFPVEIAAGIILIGSCSSGLASNVMSYLARANLVLSVTITAFATLAAPIMTPFLMKTLAGTLVSVKFLGMMMQIIKIVLIPIGAALLHDYLKRASAVNKRRMQVVTVACAGWLVLVSCGGWTWFSHHVDGPVLSSISIFGFMTAAVVAGVAYHWATLAMPRLDRWMPYLSMAGIVYFTLVTTAAGRDSLLQIGFMLFIAAVIHNSAGYVLGYWLSRAFGLDKNSARAVALEVGLQNGGMASGLAGAMGKLGTVGLASAVFSPWMNISGSLLANYWRKRPVDGSAETAG